MICISASQIYFASLSAVFNWGMVLSPGGTSNSKCVRVITQGGVGGTQEHRLTSTLTRAKLVYSGKALEDSSSLLPFLFPCFWGRKGITPQSRLAWNWQFCISLLNAGITGTANSQNGILFACFLFLFFVVEFCFWKFYPRLTSSSGWPWTPDPTLTFSRRSGSTFSHQHWVTLGGDTVKCW